MSQSVESATIDENTSGRYCSRNILISVMMDPGAAGVRSGSCNVRGQVDVGTIINSRASALITVV